MAANQKKIEYKNMSNSNKKKPSTQNGSSQKSTANKKRTAKSLEVTNKGSNSELKDEIVLISMIVVAILLLLSYFNLSGKFGEAVNSFVFGTFGFIAYLLPFLLFFGTAFIISNKDNKRAIYKMISVVVLSIILTGFMQMLGAGYNVEMSILDYYEKSSQSKNGGGLIGGSICKLFCPLFGVAGTYVILIALILIIILFITEKALFANLSKKGNNMYLQAKKERLERKQYEIEHPQENVKLSRKDRKAEKGNVNIVLNKKTNNNHDIREITDEYTISNESNNMEEKDFFIKDFPIQRMQSIQEEIVDNSFMDEEPFDNNYEENIPLVKESISIIKEEEPIKKNIEVEKPIDDYINSIQESKPVKIISKSGKVIEKDDNMLDVNTMERDNKPKQNTTFSYTEKINKKDTQVKEDPNDFIKARLNAEKKEHVFPPIDMMKKGDNSKALVSDQELKATAFKLQQTLESFNVRVSISNVSCGPSVTRYELQPEQGVKVSKIVSLADDIKLNLAAADVRIEAPIPGKSAVGIEVPNKENSAVMLRDIIESPDFKKHPSDIAFAVGKDIGGQAVVTDIAKMPHLLIAGATGSGKSVCINTLIMSILYKAKPSDVKLIMIDPKVVELSVYNGIPHLMIPVVTDPKKASAALNWAVAEMTDRYKKFADYNVRDLKGYNAKIEDEIGLEKLPQIVIIVDELADLMMVAPGEVEDAICRLAQMARAAGLHLIIATQRPSVNVITGLIKANVPSRIAFSVSSGVDSRTIIDMNGAEKLLGKGDMLFFPAGLQKPVRIQGAFVSDKEVSTVVEFLASQNKDAIYPDDMTSKITNVSSIGGAEDSGSNGRDAYFADAGKFIIEKDKASIGMLQRVYKIGFNRAARIMDQLYEAGVVGPEEGTKPRKILMSIEDFEKYIEEYV